MKPADDNIHFEVRVKGELGVTTDGKEDYFDKFVEFKQSFIDREIIPIHVFSPKSDFTLYGDGSVGVNSTFMFYERSEHASADEPNVWKSKAYLGSTWAPLTPDSLNIEDWRITKYIVNLVELSDTFGQAPDDDACKDLC